MDWLGVIDSAEQKYNLKPGVLKKLIEVESGGNINAQSPRGAIGLSQLMPETAKELGVNPNDPVQNIEGGAKYLAQNLAKFNGDYGQAIAGYNAGPNHKAVVNRDFNGLPDETKKYTQKFLDFIVPTASANEAPYQASPPNSPPDTGDIQWEPQTTQATAHPQDQGQDQPADNSGDIQWGDTTTTPSTPEAPASESFLQSVGHGAMNLPMDTVKYAGEAGSALLHPIDTLTGMGDVVRGGMQKALPANIADWAVNSGISPEARPAADQFGQLYKDRYGSWDKVKNSIANSPAHVLGDATMVSGGLAGLAKGIAPRSAEAAGALAKSIDPLLLVGKGVVSTGKGLSSFLGVNSGLGYEAIQAAVKAGVNGGQAAKAFIAHATGSAPAEDIVTTAKTGLKNMYKERGAAYQKALDDGIISDPTTLSFAPIRKAVDDIKSMGTYHDINVNPAATGVQSAIDKMVSKFEKDPTIHNVEGFDALKKGIGKIRDKTDFHTPERVVADSVYHAVSDEINKQAPGYAKIMKDYQKASALTTELQKSLSLGEKSTIDTTLRKLQSLMRNNVNTTYGRRLKLGDMLEQHGASNLRAKIAGQAISSWEPRGLARLGAQGGGTGAIASAAMGHPLVGGILGAQVLMSSPKLVGYLAHGIGRFSRPLEKGYAIAPQGLANFALQSRQLDNQD